MAEPASSGTTSASNHNDDKPEGRNRESLDNAHDTIVEAETLPKTEDTKPSKNDVPSDRVNESGRAENTLDVEKNEVPPDPVYESGQKEKTLDARETLDKPDDTNDAGRAGDVIEKPHKENAVALVKSKLGAAYNKITSHLGNDGPTPNWLVHILGICVIPVGLLIANITVCTIRSKGNGCALFNTDIGVFLPCMIAFAGLVLLTQIICYVFECRVHNALKLAGLYVIVTTLIVCVCLWCMPGITPEIIIIDANFLWLILYVMVYAYVYFRNMFHVLWPFGAIASNAVSE